MDDLEEQSPQETPPGPAPTTNAAEIAARIAQENRDAVPQGGGAAAQSPGNPPAGPTDVLGRPFDPALHLTKRDGVTPAIRAGKLVSKAGRLTGPKPKAPVAAAGGDTGGKTQEQIALEAIGGGKGPGGEGDAGAGAEGGDHFTTQGPAPLAPEDFARRAVLRAQAARKIAAKVGRWLGGQDGEFQEVEGSNEGQDIQDATLDIQTEYQRLLPINSIIMGVLAYGSYFARVATAAQRRKREAAKAKAQGRAIPDPDDKEQQDQPAKDGDQPTGPRPHGAPGADLATSF